MPALEFSVYKYVYVVIGDRSKRQIILQLLGRLCRLSVCLITSALVSFSLTLFLAKAWIRLELLHIGFFPCFLLMQNFINKEVISLLGKRV